MSGKNLVTEFAAWADRERNTPAPEAVAAYAAHLADRSLAPERFEVTTRTHRITVELDTEFPNPRGFTLGRLREWNWTRAAREEIVAEAIRALAAAHVLDQPLPDDLQALDDVSAGCTLTFVCDHCVLVHPCACTPGVTVLDQLTIKGHNFLLWIEYLALTHR